MQEYLWVPLTLLCAGIVWYLTYRGISISTRVGVALGLIEIGIMVFVSALLVINAGSRNTISVFIPGDAGIQPALQGMVFCLLAFVGFEAAAPLAEETRDPKRNTRRAILWSAILIGLFYVFCYYAATVYFGPDKMADFIASNDGNPWGGMAEQVLPGIGSLLVTFAILNSCLANANSGANASTRSVFALGRSRLLPAAFGAVHPTHRTPATAIHLQAIVGIIIAVGLSLYLGNQYPRTPGPLNTYFTIGYAIGLLFAGDVHGGQPRDDRLLLARAARRVQLVQAPDHPDHRLHPDDPGVPRRPRWRHRPDPRPEAGAARRAVLVRAAARRDLDADRHRHRPLLLVPGARQAPLRARGHGRDRRGRRPRRTPLRRPRRPDGTDGGSRDREPPSPRRRHDRAPYADHPCRPRPEPPRLGPGDPAGRDGRRRATSSSSTASTRRTDS